MNVKNFKMPTKKPGIEQTQPITAAVQTYSINNSTIRFRIVENRITTTNSYISFFYDRLCGSCIMLFRILVMNRLMFDLINSRRINRSVNILFDLFVNDPFAMPFALFNRSCLKHRSTRTFFFFIHSLCNTLKKKKFGEKLCFEGQ